LSRNSTYRVTIATAQTHCHATAPAALLWKRYQDLTCHIIIIISIIIIMIITTTIPHLHITIVNDVISFSTLEVSQPKYPMNFSFSVWALILRQNLIRFYLISPPVLLLVKYRLWRKYITFCYLQFLCAKYLPERSVLKHPQYKFSLRLTKTSKLKRAGERIWKLCLLLTGEHLPSLVQFKETELVTNDMLFSLTRNWSSAYCMNCFGPLEYINNRESAECESYPLRFPSEKNSERSIFPTVR
jgi:hypothetical protein